MSTSRRDFLSGLGMATVAGTVAYTSTMKKYGHLTVESHFHHKRLTGETLRVYFNGQDVTDQCNEADDVEGWVSVYAKDSEQIRKWLGHDGYYHSGSRLLVHGDVVIKPGAAIP